MLQYIKSVVDTSQFRTQTAKLPEVNKCAVLAQSAESLEDQKLHKIDYNVMQRVKTAMDGISRFTVWRKKQNLAKTVVWECSKLFLIAKSHFESCFRAHQMWFGEL